MNTASLNKKFLILISFAFALSGCAKQPAQTNTVSDTTTSSAAKELADPIDNAAARITKKPFGIKVTPQNSPVSPERFSGYHTGTDFETTFDEKDQEILVYALCSGKLLQARTADGYGGVAVQQCNIKGESVTVVYGHIDTGSLRIQTGESIKTGEPLAILAEQGPGTDGERKHLHLSIHKGTSINIKGYVQSEAELADWLDWKEL